MLWAAHWSVTLYDSGVMVGQMGDEERSFEGQCRLLRLQNRGVPVQDSGRGFQYVGREIAENIGVIGKYGMR